MHNMHRCPDFEAELLLWADGELAADASRRMSSHLADCSGCRVELEDREDVLQAFTQVHHDLTSSAMTALPQRWEPLEQRIQAWENRLRIGSLLGRLGDISRPRYALAGALVLALTLVAVFLQTWQETVSANELLTRAGVAQSESARNVPASMMHETLQIRRSSSIREQDAVLEYESWQDASGNLLRETSSSEAIVAELRTIYRSNGLDWNSPLSAAAYERWRTSLTKKHDSVVHTGQSRITLTTLSGGQSRGDAISMAQLVVRSSDWRPVAARFWVHGLEYEITELSFAAIPVLHVEPSSEAPVSQSLVLAPAASIRKPQIVGGGQRQAANATSTHSPDPVQSAEPRREVFSTPETTPFQDSTSLSDGPSMLRHEISGKDVPAAMENGAASGRKTAPLVSAPAPRPAVVITFTSRPGKPQQLLPEFPQPRFPTVVTPTALPVAMGPRQHQNHVNTEPFKALASKLGLTKRKKKAETVEPAKPGG